MNRLGPSGLEEHLEEAGRELLRRLLQNHLVFLICRPSRVVTSSRVVHFSPPGHTFHGPSPGFWNSSRL
ncbi:hypothetical protein AB0D04_31885 [Streptomyces sp. NPDC048483]|uniref:hypothetical protein n=1 Tax=Streptomyces sp. NPDC048483 TaxID=3154927 RepID=UPI003448CA51